MLPETTILPKNHVPSVSISLTEMESQTYEIFIIQSYNDLYLVNSVLDRLSEFAKTSPTSLDTLSLGLPEFDDLLQEFPGQELVLSFPNDTDQSMMLPLNLFLEPGNLDLQMYLNDARHIINEAFKRAIINSNILLRFNYQDGTYFYLKASSLMGDISILPAGEEENQVIFSFKTNLKYPETFDFSKVISISNIDPTRFAPFYLTNAHLLLEPEELVGQEKVYSLLFTGFLSPAQ